MILAVVLLVLLGISLLGNLKSLVGSVISLGPAAAGAGGVQLQEALVEDNRSSAKIAIVDVDGLIYGGYVGAGRLSPVEVIAQQLRRARQDPRVRAVLLRINSPGGEVLAADEIARALEEFEAKSGKPVIAVMEGLAASGGYYVAAPCRWIVANELTLTGSIGVIMQGYNYHGLLEKVGVRPMVFKSGRFKDMLRGSKAPEEILPEEQQMIQQLIDDTFARFKQVIAEGRRKSDQRNEGKGRKLEATWEDLADGRVLSGRQAYDAGFVDELGSFRTAVSRAKDLANIADANLVRYQVPRGLGDLLGLFGESENRVVKLDLGLVGPQLEAGRPYYLFAPGLH